MRTAARLTFRLYRFELIAIVLYALLLAALALVVTARLNAINPGADCLKAWLTQGPPATSGCDSAADFFSRNEAEAGKVMAAMWLLPLAAGVVIGSVLIAREIEHRTTQFAWSVGTSRRRWYLDRLLPVTIVAIGVVTLAAIAAELLESARMPWMDAVASASDYGLRGPVVVALAFATLGVSVLVSSMVGRILPALLIAAVLAVALRAVVNSQVPFGEPMSALNQDVMTAGFEYPLVVDQGWRTDDGKVLTTDEAIASLPPGSDDPYTLLYEKYGPETLGVPARDVWRVELRQSAIFLVVGLGTLVAAGYVVARRRPY